MHVGDCDGSFRLTQKALGIRSGVTKSATGLPLNCCLKLLVRLLVVLEVELLDVRRQRRRLQLRPRPPRSASGVACRRRSGRSAIAGAHVDGDLGRSYQ